LGTQLEVAAAKVKAVSSQVRQSVGAGPEQVRQVAWQAKETQVWGIVAERTKPAWQLAHSSDAALHVRQGLSQTSNLGNSRTLSEERPKAKDPSKRVPAFVTRKGVDNWPTESRFLSKLVDW
jgi:hypothetical protein